jgi:hypothetical protein
MAKSSKIEPVNIELYEKAWGRFGRGVDVVAKSLPKHRIKKQSSGKKKKRKKSRKRKTKK